MKIAVRWASDELSETLALLSSQQAQGIVRIVQAELEGKSLSSLLDCDDQICTSTTYYGSGKRKGWRGKEEFQKALNLARRDYREWMLEHGTGEALLILTSTAPDAARALRQRVVGDRSALAVLEVALQASEPGLRSNAASQLGRSGLPEAVAPLRSALQREKVPAVREAIVEALGLVASGLARDLDAAESVLDRAAVETATKSQQALTDGQGQPLGAGFAQALQGMDDTELEQLLVNLEVADGSDGDLAVPSEREEQGKQGA